MLESYSTSIAEKCLLKAWLSCAQGLKLIKDVKLFGTTSLSLPWGSSLATLLNLAMVPSAAKEAMLPKSSSSRPLDSLNPSSLRLTTLTTRSVSLGTIPVGRMLRMLVLARYSLANLRS